jgi:hypothetical protein
MVQQPGAPALVWCSIHGGVKWGSSTPVPTPPEHWGLVGLREHRSCFPPGEHKENVKWHEGQQHCMPHRTAAQGGLAACTAAPLQPKESCAHTPILCVGAPPRSESCCIQCNYVSHTCALPSGLQACRMFLALLVVAALPALMWLTARHTRKERFHVDRFSRRCPCTPPIQLRCNPQHGLPDLGVAGGWRVLCERHMT